MSPFEKKLFDGWSSPNWLTWLVSPLSGLYRFLNGIRGFAYSIGLFKSHRVSVPVVIVGNISVGGTGKTPLTLALVELLKAKGYKPGIISRGYGGKALEWPQVVKPDSNPHYIGDEAVLIAAKCGCPVVVGPERVKAARQMIEEFGVDIIVSDDGLQHHALARDIEIAVVDMQRQHRNLFCLPSGPLREPVKRLKSVDMVLFHLGKREIQADLLKRFGLDLNLAEVTSMTLKPQALKPFVDGVTEVPQPPTCIHAVAGIGHPQRFFKLLKRMGYDVIEHAFADHHEFLDKDFYFDNGSLVDENGNDIPIVMTEKDAVKCAAFAKDNFFYLPVSAELNELAEQKFLALLDEVAFGKIAKSK